MTSCCWFIVGDFLFFVCLLAVCLFVCFFLSFFLSFFVLRFFVFLLFFVSLFVGWLLKKKEISKKKYIEDSYPPYN